MHNVKDWAVVSHSPSPARRRCCGCWAERLRGSAACSGVYRGLEQYSDKTPRAATRWCLWAPSSTAPAESKTVQHWSEEVKGHLQTDFTYCTCRVFNRRPFRKMGKLTKLLYLVTTSAKQSTVTSVSFFSKHVMFYVDFWGLHTFDSVFWWKLFAVVFKVEHDLGPLTHTWSFCDLKHSRAIDTQNSESKTFKCLLCLNVKMPEDSLTATNMAEMSSYFVCLW